FQVEMWGQGDRAEQGEQELMKPVVDAMDAVIADLAEEEGYDMIFDAASSGMLFGHKDLDLTATVMERLGITPPEGGPGGGGR
ncbi:MAG: OmpH family outer membrane protein, partial [bacterium]